MFWRSVAGLRRFEAAVMDDPVYFVPGLTWLLLAVVLLLMRWV